jgi:hypothetical protein
VRGHPFSCHEVEAHGTARLCILLSRTESESESYITTDGQSASLSWNKTPVWGLRPHFYYCQTIAGLLMWGAVSDERTGLSFTVAPGPRQRSLFESKSHGTRDHILLPQIGHFHFRRLLRLTGLRWRYSTPPPRRSCILLTISSSFCTLRLFRSTHGSRPQQFYLLFWGNRGARGSVVG